MPDYLGLFAAIRKLRINDIILLRRIYILMIQFKAPGSTLHVRLPCSVIYLIHNGFKSTCITAIYIVSIVRETILYMKSISLLFMETY